MTPAVFPSLIARTRQTLDQAVARYTATLQDAAEGSAAQVATVKAGLEQIQQLNTKLESRCLRVAMFGLVSRGKSAVINALVGETVLETGPLHGVTRWPRSVYWQAEDAVDRDGNRWQIELVDTPGLDEVGGDVRAEMAQTVAQQATSSYLWWQVTLLARSISRCWNSSASKSRCCWSLIKATFTQRSINRRSPPP